MTAGRGDRRDVVAFVAQTNRSCGTCALVEGHCERKVARCTNALAARGGAIENGDDDNYVPHSPLGGATGWRVEYEKLSASKVHRHSRPNGRRRTLGPFDFHYGL